MFISHTIIIRLFLNRVFFIDKQITIFYIWCFYISYTTWNSIKSITKRHILDLIKILQYWHKNCRINEPGRGYGNAGNNSYSTLYILFCTFCLIG